MAYYFKNEKTGKKYLVLSFDKEAGTVRLKGPFGEFSEPYDKDRFVKMGYKLVNEEATLEELGDVE